MNWSSLYTSLSSGGKLGGCGVTVWYIWWIWWVEDDSHAIIIQELLHKQSRVSRSLVVMDKPISIVPFSGFLLQIFLYTSWDMLVNHLTPNDRYSGRTAPLTSKHCIFYIYSTNIGTEYFKHGIYSLLFSLQYSVCFIILTYLVPVLFTFYIQGVLKFKK